MSRTPRNTRHAAGVFLVAGLLALGYVAYVVVDAKAYQAIEQRRFEDLRGQAAVGPELIRAMQFIRVCSTGQRPGGGYGRLAYPPISRKCHEAEKSI